jgi:spermidine synthase
MVKNVLKADGIFITHATEINYLLPKNISYSIFTDLKKIFKMPCLYYEYIPSFGTLWGFIAASTKYNLRKLSPRIVSDRLKSRGLENLLYYNFHSHTRLFTLPEFLKNLFV